MRTQLARSTALASALLTVCSYGQEYSKLWGRNGEKWNPRSRLPDFSFAGCHCGDPKLQAALGVSVARTATVDITDPCRKLLPLPQPRPCCWDRHL